MIEGKEAVAIAGTIAGAVCFWAAVYGWGQWLNRPRPETHRLDSTEQDERLRRIEAAIEAMTIEVERIGEGQRFTTRLLAEKTSLMPPDQPSRPYLPAVTPH